MGFEQSQIRVLIQGVRLQIQTRRVDMSNHQAHTVLYGTCADGCGDQSLSAVVVIYFIAGLVRLFCQTVKGAVTCRFQALHTSFYCFALSFRFVQKCFVVLTKLLCLLKRFRRFVRNMGLCEQQLLCQLLSFCFAHFHISPFSALPMFDPARLSLARGRLARQSSIVNALI